MSGPPSCCLEEGDAADDCVLYCARLSQCHRYPLTRPHKAQLARILSGRGSAGLAGELGKNWEESWKCLSISFQQNQVMVPAQAGLHSEGSLGLWLLLAGGGPSGLGSPRFCHPENF